MHHTAPCAYPSLASRSHNINERLVFPASPLRRSTQETRSIRAHTPGSGISRTAPLHQQLPQSLPVTTVHCLRDNCPNLTMHDLLTRVDHTHGRKRFHLYEVGARI